ncbi:hypothetical protein AAVH_18024 [Aphelenchoides avenae]|nr:hypothetical protein AAVH_18024 [Aphelenchus avenae]
MFSRTERRRRQWYGYGYPAYYGSYHNNGYGRYYSGYNNNYNYHNQYPNYYSPAYYNGHNNGYNNYVYANGGYRVGCWGTLCYDGKYHGNGRFNGARCVGLLCVLMYAAQGYPIHG